MRQYEIDLTRKINELCEMYKRYMASNSDSRLNILIQENSICLKLFKDIELIDEFEIKFEKREKDIHEYSSVLIVLRLFDERKIFDGSNMVYNKMDNPNLKLEILDDNILDIVLMMIASNNPKDFYNMICNNLVWRFYPRKFMNKLEERIGMSRKLLRMDDMK